LPLQVAASLGERFLNIRAQREQRLNIHVLQSLGSHSFLLKLGIQHTEPNGQFAQA
jgi:hypothetical protein